MSFQIADICDQTCDEEIRIVLHELPRGLPETYERALNRISKNNKSSIAQKVFRWVLVARRPLSIEELGEAVVIEPGQHFLRPGQLINDINQILPWCGNLLIQDEEEHLVHFAHHTVKEFLLARRSTSTLQCFVFDMMNADHEAGETCCTYLHLDNLKKQAAKAIHIEPQAIINASLPVGRVSTLCKTYLKLARSSKHQCGIFDLGTQLDSVSNTSEIQQQIQNPFLSYASEYWLSHTTTFTKAVSKTWSLFDHLVSTEEVLGIRKWSFSKLKQYGTDHSHWALLAWKWQRYDNGLARLEGALSLRKFHMSPTYPEQHERLLLLAAESQFHGALDIVSQAGLWCKLDGLIVRAARDGNLVLLETILSVKNPERYKNPRPNINNALQSAAQLGHIEVVTKLLDVKSTNRSSDPIDVDAAINLAEAGGHEVLAIMLSKVKEEIAPQRRLLAEAALVGDYLTVEALLDSGVDVNAVVDGSTALQRAAKNNRLSIVHLLLEHQADIGAGAGTPSGNVLKEAVREGRLQVVIKICRVSKKWKTRRDGEFGIRQPLERRLYGVNKLKAVYSEALKTVDFLNLLNVSDISEDDDFVIWEFLVTFGYSNIMGAPPQYRDALLRLHFPPGAIDDPKLRKTTAMPKQFEMTCQLSSGDYLDKEGYIQKVGCGM